MRFLCLWFRLLSLYRYLYHNRLHKIPSALVCRVRWVGPTPSFCDTGPQYRCPPSLADRSREANCDVIAQKMRQTGYTVNQRSLERDDILISEFEEGTTESIMTTD